MRPQVYYPTAIFADLVLLAAVLAWYPGSLGVRFVIAYLLMGCVCAAVAMIQMITSVDRQLKFTEHFRRVGSDALRDSMTIVVFLALAIFLLCYIINFVIMWPVFAFPARSTGAIGRESLYKEFAKASLSPSFWSDYFIFPVVTAVASLFLYLSSYTNLLNLPFILLATVLWTVTAARFVYYSIPSYSPAMQDIPTYLRQHYSPDRHSGPGRSAPGRRQRAE